MIRKRERTFSDHNRLQVRRLLQALCLLLLAGGTELFAQETVTELFMAAPDTVLPHFDQETKSELVSQYALTASGESADPVRNRYGGSSSILSLNDSRLVIEVDETTTLELKVLKTRNRRAPMVGVIFTDHTTPAISVFAFYNPSENWQKIQAREVIELPRPTDFLSDPGYADDLEVKKALVERGLWTYTATFGETKETITLSPTTFTDAVAQSQFPGVAAKLRPEGLSYRWRKSAFERL